MPLNVEQNKEVDTALYNLVHFELGKSTILLTELEKSLKNPKLYTREICAAYTEFTPYKGPVKNSGPIFICLFNEMVPYGWIVSRKRYFKNKIRETLYV